MNTDCLHKLGVLIQALCLIPFIVSFSNAYWVVYDDSSHMNHGLWVVCYDNTTEKTENCTSFNIQSLPVEFHFSRAFFCIALCVYGLGYLTKLSLECNSEKNRVIATNVGVHATVFCLKFLGLALFNEYKKAEERKNNESTHYGYSAILAMVITLTLPVTMTLVASPAIWRAKRSLCRRLFPHDPDSDPADKSCLFSICVGSQRDAPQRDTSTTSTNTLGSHSQTIDSSLDVSAPPPAYDTLDINNTVNNDVNVRTMDRHTALTSNMFNEGVVNPSEESICEGEQEAGVASGRDSARAHPPFRKTSQTSPAGEFPPPPSYEEAVSVYLPRNLVAPPSRSRTRHGSNHPRNSTEEDHVVREVMPPPPAYTDSEV